MGRLPPVTGCVLAYRFLALDQRRLDTTRARNTWPAPRHAPFVVEAGSSKRERGPPNARFEDGFFCSDGHENFDGIGEPVTREGTMCTAMEAPNVVARSSQYRLGHAHAPLDPSSRARRYRPAPTTQTRAGRPVEKSNRKPLPTSCFDLLPAIS